MSGQNPSGINPLEYNVLVKPYEVPKQTAGGVLLPEDHHEKVQWAETRGTVIDISPLAFDYAEGAPVPRIGEDILHAKPAGNRVKGNDDVEYLMLKDKDVLAVMEASDG